jgi:alcohol dehydrogenase
MAKAMGENVDGLSKRDAADKALAAIEKLSADIGIPRGLSELGVKESDIATMTANAQKDACGFTNPRCPTDEDVMAIYKAAL